MNLAGVLKRCETFSSPSKLCWLSQEGGQDGNEICPETPKLWVNTVSKENSKSQQLNKASKNISNLFKNVFILNLMGVWFCCITQTSWVLHRFSVFWLRSKCSICSYQLNIWYGGHVPPSILNWFLQGDEVQELAPASSRVGLALQYRQDRLTPHFPMRFLQCGASLIPSFRMGLSRLAVDRISKRLLRPSPQVL